MTKFFTFQRLNALKKQITGLAAALAIGLGTLTPYSAAQADSRIKDIVSFEGIRDNLLIGYGLVVGLNGTGDSLDGAPFTKQSLESMLERLGVNVRENTDLDTDNIAAVMVTANLPPFAQPGARIDVTVSSLGDASSLLGGTLLVTPLMGADGEVYAVAQGNIAVGGFSAGGNAETVTKGVPTGGRMPNGAIIERAITFNLGDLSNMKLTLRNPDLTTARRIVRTINTYVKKPVARMLDNTQVDLSSPAGYPGGMVGLITDIEQLRVQPDTPAKVVIDEQSGIIVMGKDVRISEAAIAQGNLTIRITETAQVSQPSPFAEVGETQVVDRTNVEVDQGEDNKLTVLSPGVSLQELVDGLNALGIGPRDMISILQSLKVAGALQADIQVM